MRAAIARFEVTDVARTAAALEASTALSRSAERLRKQVARQAPLPTSADDDDDDFYDRYEQLRGYRIPEKASD